VGNGAINAAARLLEKRQRMYEESNIMLRKNVVLAGSIDTRAAEAKRKYDAMCHQDILSS
jgi:hypothetical protein